MSTAVENLSKLEDLTPILKNLGADHISKGVEKEHYPIVMGAIIKTLKDNLGSDFTLSLRKAWKVVLKIV